MMTQKVLAVDKFNEPLTLTPEVYMQINTKEISIPVFYEH